MGSFGVGVGPRSVGVESSSDGNGDVYVTEANSGTAHVEVFTGAGTHVETWSTQFDEPHVAVDNSPAVDIADPSRCSGLECTVYVSEYGAVVKLDSKGVEVPFEKSLEYVKGARITARPATDGCAGAEGFGTSGRYPGAIAVDGQGNLYVALPFCQAVFEYRPSGQYVGEINLESKEIQRVGPEEALGTAVGVAVDPVSGHVLVAMQTSTGAGPVAAVNEFEDLLGVVPGKFVDQLSQTGETGVLEKPEGAQIAVDSHGDLAVADTAAKTVDVWDPGAYYPTVTTGTANERTGAAAVLSGSVNPSQTGNPEPVVHLQECYFQIIEATGYAQELAHKEAEGFATASTFACEHPGCDGNPKPAGNHISGARARGKPQAGCRLPLPAARQDGGRQGRARARWRPRVHAPRATGNPHAPCR